MFDFLKKIFKKNSNKRVLRFGSWHNIGFDCYNASDFKLQYGRFYAEIYTREFNNGKRKLAPPKKDWHKPEANALYFEVFRDKVKLQWRDYNDNPIEYQFYFEDIFKDKIIPHNKEDEDIINWEDPFYTNPGIVIEVDNRVLNIYVDIHLNTIMEEVRVKDYTKLVFSKTF